MPCASPITFLCPRIVKLIQLTHTSSLTWLQCALNILWLLLFSRSVTRSLYILSLKTLSYLNTNHREQRIFKFESVIDVFFFSSFCFIRIRLDVGIWLYRHQILLSSVDPCAWRVNHVSFYFYTLHYLSSKLDSSLSYLICGRICKRY